MRALKALVIVLGILLVGGTVALIVAIILRANHAPSPRQPATAAHQPFDSVLDLPAGATVRAVEPSGSTLILRIGLAEGGEQIIILDMASGARLGTIELHVPR